MSDPISNKGFGDAALAERVIEIYAESGTVPPEGAKSLGIFFPDDEQLRWILEEGRPVSEMAGLAWLSNFSEEFRKTLFGEDGKKALRQRVRWLADCAETKWWRWDRSEGERGKCLRNLSNLDGEAIGKVKEEVLPPLLRILRDDENAHHRDMATLILGGMHATAAEAVEAVIQASRDGTISPIRAIGTLGDIGAQPEIAIPYIFDLITLGFSATEGSLALQKFGKAGLHWILEGMTDESENIQSASAKAFYPNPHAQFFPLIQSASAKAFYYLPVQEWWEDASVQKLLGTYAPLIIPHMKVDEATHANVILHFAPYHIPILKDHLRRWGLQGPTAGEATDWLFFVQQFMGPDRASLVPELLLCLKSPDRGLRWSAIRSLIEIGNGSPEIVSALISSLKDKEVFRDIETPSKFPDSYLRRIRNLAIMGLGTLAPGQPNAHFVLPLLAEIRDNPAEDEKVRASARDAMEKIENGVL